MIQDLHMLKEKNRNNCIYSSMLSPFVKVDNDYSFGPMDHFNDKNKSLQSLTQIQHPTNKRKKGFIL